MVSGWEKRTRRGRCSQRRRPLGTNINYLLYPCALKVPLLFISYCFNRLQKRRTKNRESGRELFKWTKTAYRVGDWIRHIKGIMHFQKIIFALTRNLNYNTQICYWHKNRKRVAFLSSQFSVLSSQFSVLSSQFSRRRIYRQQIYNNSWKF